MRKGEEVSCGYKTGIIKKFSEINRMWITIYELSTGKKPFKMHKKIEKNRY